MLNNKSKMQIVINGGGGAGNKPPNLELSNMGVGMGKAGPSLSHF